MLAKPVLLVSFIQAALLLDSAEARIWLLERAGRASYAPKFNQEQPPVLNEIVAACGGGFCDALAREADRDHANDPNNFPFGINGGVARPRANDANVGDGDNAESDTGNTSPGNPGDIGNFGSCSVPQVEFGQGFNGRKETSFRPADQKSYPHGSADDIGIITHAMRDRLVDFCKADDAAIQTCANAITAASGAIPVKTGIQADAFNAVFGIDTNFTYDPALDDQGRCFLNCDVAKKRDDDSGIVIGEGGGSDGDATCPPTNSDCSNGTGDGGDEPGADLDPNLGDTAPCPSMNGDDNEDTSCGNEEPGASPDPNSGSGAG